MKKVITLCCSITVAVLTHAATGIPAYLNDESLLYKDVEEELKKMFVLIPGGTYKELGMEGNRFTSIVTLSDFYMQKTEVTNRWYKVFLIDLARKDIQNALDMIPDTSRWTQDFAYSYNEPMDIYYFVHRAYDDYPVVGVSYKQAKAFAEWGNEKLNAYFQSKGIKHVPFSLHLPTQSEWQYAATGGLKDNMYGYQVTEDWFAPNGMLSLYNTKTKKYRANYKTDEGYFVGDMAFHTSKVGMYEANKYGLRDMVGNVSEWTGDLYYKLVLDSSISDLQVMYASAQNLPTDLYVVKGGSWADDYKKQRINHVYACHPDSSHSYIGFRLAAYVKNE